MRRWFRRKGKDEEGREEEAEAFLPEETEPDPEAAEDLPPVLNMSPANPKVRLRGAPGSRAGGSWRGSSRSVDRRRSGAPRLSAPLAPGVSAGGRRPHHIRARRGRARGRGPGAPTGTPAAPGTRTGPGHPHHP